MLRDARERRGLSLRQLASATKIGVPVLEGLEKNDNSRLPGGIFSRGIVRSYALEVGLDPEFALREFIAQFPRDAVTVGHPAALRAEDHLAVESDRRAATTFVRLMAISVPLVVAVIYFGSAGRPGVAEEVTPLAAPTTASASSPVAESAPLISSAPAAGDTAATTGSGAPDGLRVTLSALRDCWISINIDQQKRIEQLMKAGEQRTVETNGEMVLTVGDASAMALTLNGERARPLGRDGQVVTVRLNRANFNTYVAAR